MIQLGLRAHFSIYQNSVVTPPNTANPFAVDLNSTLDEIPFSHSFDSTMIGLYHSKLLVVRERSNNYPPTALQWTLKGGKDLRKLNEEPQYACLCLSNVVAICLNLTPKI